MASPSPRITEPMWRLWTEFNAHYPPVLLGGIFAAKSGYHNSRDANDRGWPGNYSVRDAIDRQGPSDKAAALDLTFPDAQSGDYRTIARYSRRLLDAGRRRDPRLYRNGEAILREFYGNADDDREVEGWDYRYHRAVSSDSSHLWHIHLSVTRKFVDDWSALSGVLDVLTGKEDDDMASADEVAEAVYERLTHRVGDNEYAAQEGIFQPGTVLHPPKALEYGWGFGKIVHTRDVPAILAGQQAILAAVAGQDAAQAAAEASRQAVRTEMAAVRAELGTVIRDELGDASDEQLERVFRRVFGSLDEE